MSIFNRLRDKSPIRAQTKGPRWVRHEQLLQLALILKDRVKRRNFEDDYINCLDICTILVKFHSSNRDDMRSIQNRLKTMISSIDDICNAKSGSGTKLPTSWFTTSLNGKGPREHLDEAKASILYAINFLEAQLKGLKKGRPFSEEKRLRSLEQLDAFFNSNLQLIRKDLPEQFWSLFKEDVYNYDEIDFSTEELLIAHAISTLFNIRVDFKSIADQVRSKSWKKLDPLF